MIENSMLSHWGPPARNRRITPTDRDYERERIADDLYREMLNGSNELPNFVAEDFIDDVVAALRADLTTRTHPLQNCTGLGLIFQLAAQAMAERLDDAQIDNRILEREDT